MFTTQSTQGSSLFGGNATGQNQQNGGGLFGGLGNNNQQNQSQTTGGLFGGVGQNNQNQQQGGSSLFGQSQNQPQQSSLFGQNNQQNQQPSSLFTGLGQNNQQPQQSLFGQSNQQSQQQPQSMFGQPQQQGLNQSQRPQFSNTLWVANSAVPAREKSITDQLMSVESQWDVNNINCAFRYYFYNKVPESAQEYFGPGANEDPKKWEDALKKKPGPGYVPVLCVGFQQLAERLQLQALNLAYYNSQLHHINDNLDKLLHTHETSTSIRVLDAKRKHLVLKRRCLVLATKVQILRNRGYAMGGDEEDLKAKLVALDKGVNDPALDARQEEIWARMVSVQERARLLKAEIERSGQPAEPVIDAQTTKQAHKILEDYQRQLIHLKKELDSIQEAYVGWEKEHAAP